MTGIETLLVLTVAALDLAVVSGRIGTDELMPDAELSGRVLKQRRNIPLGVRKAVGKFKSIVGLDTLDVNTPACIPFDQPF